MTISCAHSRDGLCAACSKINPYLVFTESGYIWGPGHDKKAGQATLWERAEPDPKGGDRG